VRGHLLARLHPGRLAGSRAAQEVSICAEVRAGSMKAAARQPSERLPLTGVRRPRFKGLVVADTWATPAEPLEVEATAGGPGFVEPDVHPVLLVMPRGTRGLAGVVPDPRGARRVGLVQSVHVAWSK